MFCAPAKACVLPVYALSINALPINALTTNALSIKALTVYALPVSPRPPKAASADSGQEFIPGSGKDGLGTDLGVEDDAAGVVGRHGAYAGSAFCMRALTEVSRIRSFFSGGAMMTRRPSQAR